MARVARAIRHHLGEPRFLIDMPVSRALIGIALVGFLSTPAVGDVTSDVQSRPENSGRLRDPGMVADLSSTYFSVQRDPCSGSLLIPQWVALIPLAPLLMRFLDYSIQQIPAENEAGFQEDFKNAAVVELKYERGSCLGVVVKGRDNQDQIITAAHCVEKMPLKCGDVQIERCRKSLNFDNEVQCGPSDIAICEAVPSCGGEGLNASWTSPDAKRVWVVGREFGGKLKRNRRKVSDWQDERICLSEGRGVTFTPGDSGGAVFVESRDVLNVLGIQVCQGTGVVVPLNRFKH